MMYKNYTNMSLLLLCTPEVIDCWSLDNPSTAPQLRSWRHHTLHTVTVSVIITLCIYIYIYIYMGTCVYTHMYRYDRYTKQYAMF